MKIIRFIFIFLMLSIKAFAASFLNVSDASDFFTPNGDNISDKTLISYTCPVSAYVDVTIYDSINNIVRNLKKNVLENAASNSVYWDGKDNSGVIMPEGTYTYIITGRDSTTNVPLSASSGTVAIANRFMNISEPIGSTISGIVNFKVTPTSYIKSCSSVDVYYRKKGTTPLNLIGTAALQADNSFKISCDTQNLSNIQYEVLLICRVIDLNNNSRYERTSPFTYTINNTIFQNVLVTPNFFTPNGDTISDTATINYTCTNPMKVNIKIYNSSNTLVKTLKNNITENAGANSAIWDGTNDLGSILPDGVYKYKLNGIDSTNISAPEKIGTVIIANKFMKIIEPSVSTISGIVNCKAVPTNYIKSCSSVDVYYRKKGTTPLNSIGTAVLQADKSFTINWDTQNLSNIQYDVLLICRVIDLNNNSRYERTSPVTCTINNTVFQSVSVAPDFFTPNGDAISDTATINYTCTNPMKVSIKIYDSSNALVKILKNNVSENAGANSATWDGTNDLGLILPDGVYTYKLNGINSTNVSAPEKVGTVTIAGKFMKITEPSGSTISGIVSFKAVPTNYIKSCSSVDVYYRKKDTTSLNFIGNAALQADNSFIISWNTGNLLNIQYEVLLICRVIDLNNRSRNERTSPFIYTVNNPFEIKIDCNDQYLTNKPQFTLSGQTISACNINYIRVNGVNADTIDQYLHWSKQLSLTEGNNTIVVSGKNTANLINEKTITLILDTTPPVIISTWPQEGEKIRDTQPQIKIFLKPGTMDINLSKCYAKIGSLTLGATYSDNEKIIFSCPDLLTIDGEKTLFVHLEDKAGNPTEQNTHFILDTTSPISDISPQPGTYSAYENEENYTPGGIQVSFQTNEENTQTYYTLDGTDPIIGSTKTHLNTGEPIVVKNNTTVKYFSIDEAGNQEQIKSASYIYRKKLSEIVLNISSSIQWNSLGDGIKYNVYRIPIKDGWDDLDPVYFSQNWASDGSGLIYNFGRIPNEVLNPFDAQFKINSVSLNVTNFEDQTSEIGKSYIYFVQAVGLNDERSAVNPSQWRNNLVVKKPPVIGASHKPGFYNEEFQLTLKSDYPSEIYYTTDGSDPNSNSLNAPSPIVLNISSDVVIKFYAERNGIKGNVETYQYKFDYDKPVINAFTPDDKSFFSNYYVTIQASFQDSLSGIDPLASELIIDGFKFNGIITNTGLNYQQAYLDGTHTVELKIRDMAGNTTSTTRTFTVGTIPVQTSISPKPGFYKTSQTVTLTSNRNSIIYYTIDGSIPEVNSATTLSGNSPLTLQIQNNTTVKYFSVDDGGNAEDTINSATYTIDADMPVILSSYPANASNIATQGKPLIINITFGDANSGIKTESVKFYDNNLNEITSDVTATNNNLKYILQNPANKRYEYQLNIEDLAGNNISYKFYFNVDSSIPQITSDVNTGQFSSPFDLKLKSTENATMYYSVDGYTPSEGASNTFSVSGSETNIQINKTTKLQYFAVDSAGNRSEMKTQIYYFNELPGTVTGLNAQFDENEHKSILEWAPYTFSIQGYHVYRAINIQELTILKDSFQNNYPAPAKLRISPSVITNTNFNDIDLSPGIRYWYAVSVVDSNGIEGPACRLISIMIPESSNVLNKDEAIQRSLKWIESNQKLQGYWGGKDNIRLLATCQILSSLKIVNIDTLWLRQALFYIRGHRVDNNDYLSRQILILNKYNQNTDEAVNDLISHAYISGIYLYGFGIQQRYSYDALTTALGSNAIKCTKNSHGKTNVIINSLLNYSLQSTDGKYGWVPRKDTSIFVSAFVYNTVLSGKSTYQWIIDSQKSDGSFGNGLIDTAAVLIWLTLDDQIKTKAVNYLISKQNNNGSWNNDDAYVTGLCLEAILRN